MFEVKIKKSALKELAKLGNEAGIKIIESINNDLSLSPSTAGKKLKGKLRDFWSYRIGDYRVIYNFNNVELWVLVVKVGHRKDVYSDE